MRLYKFGLPGVLAITLLMMPRAAVADNWSVGVSVGQVSDFYRPLSRHGYWVDVGSYGRCWYPAYVEHDWRPYAEGYWLWTDGGWYWESEEPWAWATYHYGRWVSDPYYGWVWVPDTVWGPAWVGWREGGNYIGWAPLPPGCREFGPDGMLIIGANVIAPGWFVFVEHGHFCERIHRRDVIFNQTIINQTINITHIRRGDHNIINNGPDFDAVQRRIGHRLEPRQIDEIRRVETERGAERPSYGHARVKLPPPIASTTEEPNLGGRKPRETVVAQEYGKPKGNGPIERGAEKLTKSPREEIRVPNATRPTPGPADIIVPRSEQTQRLQESRQDRNAGREKLDRGLGNAPPVNYGNFPTGKAYGMPMSAPRSAPEIAQPRGGGGRTPVSDDPNGRNPDRSSGRGRD